MEDVAKFPDQERNRRNATSIDFRHFIDIDEAADDGRGAECIE